MTTERKPFRAGDSVQVHNPDGTPFEKWLLAADEYEGTVVCCGWQVALHSGHSMRSSWARRDLAREGLLATPPEVTP